MPITLNGSSGGQGLINSFSAVNSTSGAVIDFGGIPSTAKRVTVLFRGVSTTGTSAYVIQLGTSASITTSGYSGAATGATTGVSSATSSTYFFAVHLPAGGGSGAAASFSGVGRLCLLGSNTWAYSGMFAQDTVAYTEWAAGSIALAGALATVRITTANGTDTFDAGQINVLYE